MPTIAIVDDNQEGGELQALLSENAIIEIYHPRDVTFEIVKDADLVLVDYKLEDARWIERQETNSIVLQPIDGIALSMVLRRHIASLEKHPPTAFALLTSFIDDIVRPFPHDNRNHQIARWFNLEWVFEKPQNNARGLADSILALASGVENLPSTWGEAGDFISDAELLELMGVQAEDPLADRYLEDVKNAKPPIHQLIEWSHGLAFLRWFMHRVLPYSCFLIDAVELSRHLRITPTSLSSELGSGRDLDKTLGSFEYRGDLSGFRGKRWWRSGVSQFLWDSTDGDRGNAEAVAVLLNSMAGKELDCLKCDYPTAIVDSDFKTSHEFAELDECVQIQPDGWPSFAEPAFTSIEWAKEHNSLRSLVIRKDKGKLD